jgi:hypothetical protein
MAKARGHRANKPNDSFGTINNSNLYRGNYRDDVYKDDDEEPVTEMEAQSDPSQEEATPDGFSRKSKQDDVDYKKRYDDLKRHYDAKVSEWKEEKKDLAAQGESSPQLDALTRLKAPKSLEELEQFKQQYPDVYGVVETISALRADSTVEELRNEVNRLREREQDMEVQKAYQELLRHHPDFDDLRNDDKFLAWLDEQPSTLSDGIYKNNTDAKWAARVIDLYKADTGLSKNKRGTNASAAETVTKRVAKDVNAKGTGGQRIWKASEIGRMKPHEFEANEAELDAARAEGRIDFNA